MSVLKEKCQSPKQVEFTQVKKLKSSMDWKVFDSILGPEVRGTRPVLVTFESFKDRDEVLRKVKMRSMKYFMILFVL